MKFYMLVQTDGETGTTKEEFNENSVGSLPEARAFCQRVIDRFNQTRRGDEAERKMVWVAQAENAVPASHTWEKASLVTEKGGYDKMRCTVCKATGKRYGLAGRVVVDGKHQKRLNCITVEPVAPFVGTGPRRTRR